MLLSRSICSGLLALSFHFSTAQGQDDKRIIIGYRTVSEEEAYDINAKNKPMRDEGFDFANRVKESDQQIGPGYYLVNHPAGWPAEKGDWHCVIKANKDEFDDALKVWIPEYFETIDWLGKVKRVDLWTGDMENIADYMLLVGLPARLELRFSRIKGAETAMLQMVIPSKVVNKNHLDLWGQCWSTAAELKQHANQIVNWEQWAIAGDPTVAERFHL
ncbi:uncharacterized protein L3040_001949 [Drepanopeziza brunnea f. sp. 'multigermtubi']|uniref:uncharacterized protein n=1 Tax=Drepanopeziza brunnea f. sp. 'multigermtubi' TaxID=698441 RepID=UPI0023A460FE|nr:hypothetical protein L3040_001949 [Drepanopeziza brunnea f. sp. 'multigermtubi']